MVNHLYFNLSTFLIRSLVLVHSLLSFLSVELTYTSEVP